MGLPCNGRASLQACGMKNLWSANHPRDFWQCRPQFSNEAWQEAITRALPSLGLSMSQADIDSILAQTLGEGRFGPGHWELGFTKRVYYLLKPLIPRTLTRRMRRIYNRESTASESWAIERGYVDFLYEVLHQLQLQGGNTGLKIRDLWPDHHRYAFCLTHDIETATGQSFVTTVAKLEEDLGFRSLFNFVPESYKLDYALMGDLRGRGFEVGVHGLRHDGRLFSSKQAFLRKAGKINHALKKWEARGFRAELTLRQPEWMQSLEIDYDLSFFDSDPFEPIPGGTMSIWPFFIGHFVELPYTLVQDYTLISVLGETSPRLWLQKVDFIEKYRGMALLNSHPDFLKSPTNWHVYYDFLQEMKERSNYWQVLPGEISRWWRRRFETCNEDATEGIGLETVQSPQEGIPVG